MFLAVRPSAFLSTSCDGGGQIRDQDGSGADTELAQPQELQPPIPVYKARSGETTSEQKARLLYQSRKRGMLENGILLSCFADRYLEGMDDKQLHIFDDLINTPSNDWDIFHWITGKTPAPAEYQSEILDMLQSFVQNKNKEQRLQQPDL